MRRIFPLFAIAALTATSALAQDAGTQMTKTELSQYLMEQNIEYDVDMATEEQLQQIRAVMDDSDDSETIRGEVTAILGLENE